MQDVDKKPQKAKKLDLSVKTIPSPVKAYTRNQKRGREPNQTWESPEWNLAECGRIVDVDSYARRAFRVKKNLFTKEGYDFVSENPERSKYIQQRFLQIELATRKPIPILLSETISSLIRCSNAFWVKVRNYKASAGRVRYIGNKKLDPIAGYFLLPPETVQIKRDEYGKILKYQQVIRGKNRIEFKPEDVIHFYFDRREGFSVGTPILTPVKDDIRALRRIEEDLELLLHNHLFPLFHYKVGTTDAPATVLSDGTNEVDHVSLSVAQMPADGCWVTSERHEIKAVETSPTPFPVDNIIDHFKQRIFTGLGVSSVDMGEGAGASRSTAQTLSRNLIDDTKSDQKDFGALFFLEVILELLLESTFPTDSLLQDDNLVFLKFNEIDLEARQAKENHLMDMFLKNGITHSEFRTGTGRKPFEGTGWLSTGDGDWAETNYGVIERDKILLQSLDEPGTPESKEETKSRTAANNAKSAKSKSETKSRTKANNTKSAGGNAVENKNKPANQTGPRPSAKLNKDFADYSSIYPIIQSKKLPLSTAFSSAEKDIITAIQRGSFTEDSSRAVLDRYFLKANQDLFSLCRRSFYSGYQLTNQDIIEVDLHTVYISIRYQIDFYLNKLQRDLYESLVQNTEKDLLFKQEDTTFTKWIFDAHSRRVGQIEDCEIKRCFNYGLAIGLDQKGTEIDFETSEINDCQLCASSILKFKNNNAIIFKELPPFHPSCGHKVRNSS
jgi:hypothetical protein